MRDPFEYNLDKGAVFERVLYTPGTYEPSNKVPGKRYTPIRLRVLYDPDYGPTNFYEEEVTSENAGARPLREGIRDLEFTSDEVRWMHRTLGELIARWDRGQP